MGEKTGRVAHNLPTIHNYAMRAWMVRGGRQGQREQVALSQGRAIVGWSEVGDLSGKSREEIREGLTAVHPDESNQLIGNWTGQLDRFVNEMRIGDVVVMPLKSDRTLAIGTVRSDYNFDDDGEGEHFREVDWHRSDVERTSLKHDLRASLKSLLTICELTRFGSVDRLEAVLNGRPDPGPVREGSPLPNRVEDLPSDTPTPMTVRELLDLVNMDRRTAQTVTAIDELLHASGLKAIPSITDAEIDEQIVVTPLDDRAQRDRANVMPLPATASDAERSVGYRIHQIPSARRAPMSVSRDDLIADARTAMLEGNFSQLAVIEAGGLAGVITWESIAISHMHGSPQTVGEAMTTSPPTVAPYANVLDVVAQIESSGYVFVRGEANEIGGIVTVADLTAEFGRDRRPLVMIEEIEMRMRRAVKAQLTDADIERSQARCKTIDRLTLGAYPFVFDDDQNWEKLGWTGIRRERLRSLVQEIADVRNSLMHFSQDPLSEQTFLMLEGTLRLLRAVDSSRTRIRPDVR
ncbi:CBS domain-containing protein [Microbacterium testaceum]|uniref:CBS domain-containing protein n=1 Tax=Microbacterium testaceum TaxID=2033 RepID=UPI0037F3EEEE